jgi:hypothetical protein
MHPSPATVLLSLLLAIVIVACVLIWILCRTVASYDSATERMFSNSNKRIQAANPCRHCFEYNRYDRCCEGCCYFKEEE